MIVAIGGKKGSGKDTAAIKLIDRGFKRVSFADPLKQMCSDAFGVEVHRFHDEALKDKPFKQARLTTVKDILALVKNINSKETLSLETSHKIMFTLVGKLFYTPREILQFVGTEVIRDLVNDNFWVNNVKDQLKGPGNYVITDCRFPNERKLVNDLEGMLIRIERPLKEDISDTCISENSLGKLDEYDFVVYNESTIKELQNTVFGFVKGEIK